MQKTSSAPSLDIVFGNTQTALQISRRVKRGELIKIGPKLYSPDMTTPPGILIRRNWNKIAAFYFPGSVLAGRTGLDLKPTEDGDIFLAAKHSRTLKLNGITFRVESGPGPLAGDKPFLGLFMPSHTRSLLDNLRESHSRAGRGDKVLSQEALENKLISWMRRYGDAYLNQLRDDAMSLAPALGRAREIQRLDALIGQLLTTRENTTLQSPLGIAVANGLPYDPARIALFEILARYLQHEPPVPLFGQIETSEGARNAAFIDAYFSNFIEGTQFEIDDAYQIAIENRPMLARPADSHDIRGTYEILANTNDIRRTPKNSGELLEILRQRHKIMMGGRPDVEPGIFKSKSNRVGETVFVDPALVNGTLIKAFEFYATLDTPQARAMFMMFMIAETHPFTDGNGRIARIMMNAELVSHRQSTIIIPTVYRDDYLLSLRRLSRTSDPTAFVSMLSRAHRFTALLPFDDYQATLQALRVGNAFRDANEGFLLLAPDSLSRLRPT